MFYSASTKGFYDPNIHRNMPNDVKEISHQDYLALLEAQSTGKQIVADGAGRPIAANPPPLTLEQLRAEYKSQAKQALEITDMTALRCFKNAIMFSSDWVRYTQDLRAIITSSNVDPAIPLPTRPAYPAGS